MELPHTTEAGAGPSRAAAGNLDARHPARVGRPIVHLATRAIIGWTVPQPISDDQARIAALLDSLDQPTTTTASYARRPLVIVPWGRGIPSVLADAVRKEQMRRHGVLVEVPSPQDARTHERALASLAAAGQPASIEFDGDVRPIVAAHELRILSVVRIADVQRALSGLPMGLESRLGRKMLEILHELDVTVIADRVGSTDAAHRLRRAGARFAQGEVFEAEPNPPGGKDARTWRVPSSAPDKGETERVHMIRASEILGPRRDPVLDAVVRLLSERSGTPAAALVIVDHERPWIKAAHGVSIENADALGLLSAEAIGWPDPVAVGDAQTDHRLSTHLLVLRGQAIRSYCVATLRASNGLAFGALCAVDTRLRGFDPEAVIEARSLAQLITESLELRSRRP